MYFLMRACKPISLLIGGYSCRKEFAPLEQILSFKSNPQIRSDTVSTIKVENIFFIFQRVWKTVKRCRGKIREF